MKSHLTEACEHDQKSWCIHCEEGCKFCGVLEGIDDDGYCVDCSPKHAQLAADFLYERMKYGD